MTQPLGRLKPSYSFRLKRVVAAGAICAVILFLWYYGYFISESPLVNVMKNPVNTLSFRLKKTRKIYEFVVFKKKPGWHFVRFPCHYVCEDDGVEVKLRFSTKASSIVGADGVFFSTGPFLLEEWDSLHHYRPPHQFWVFATQEPASIVPRLLPPKVYRYNTYNWSFTFHSNSDIHGAYGWYTPHISPPKSLKQHNWHITKPRVAAWASSRHCQEGLGWKRRQFVLDLGRHIPIDMYGLCGNKTLSRYSASMKRTLETYKFYLSLENSCCSEYMSEKVWNALEQWKSVPIVIGATKEEYRRLAPPHSFIHADDFSSLKEMADYIRKVSENEELYNEYHNWRNKGYVRQQPFRYRFPVFKEGVCKVVHKMETINYTSAINTFDPYGSDWFGSCYRCGEHAWIQDYNNWGKRTIFSEGWEDNRTLYWMDNGN